MYNSLPFSSFRTSIANRKALQREIVVLRAQLRATSSQDEFAKWAKLSRVLEKKVAELETLSKFFPPTTSWLSTCLQICVYVCVCV